MQYYIYRITNWYNGKVYIGVHRTENLDDGYMGSGKALKQAIKKYGIEYFTKDILQFFDTAEEMFDAEAVVVNEEFVKDAATYNLKVGGRGSLTHENCVRGGLSGSYSLWYGPNSKESRVKHKAAMNSFWTSEKGIKSRKKHSDWCKDFWQLPEYENSRIKHRETSCKFTGKSHTPEAKAKIGAANSARQQGVNNSQYGTCWIHSLERKESKKIPKGELDMYRAQGWIRGRKQKF